ncbi:hypothetical protein DPMN_080411 [Dreissena polymorpha]|uniref:Uncharacterized protein n=1 Tax=Dreissena polymorpha TaxID=45954 RepID=A0A9D3YRC1_DREPO|nr:hypothetical protein DPMN_080411 [Dreissena polymorpha]
MALLPSGNRRGGCLIGAAFPVFMACSTKLVRPMSSGEEENTLLYLQRRLLRSAFSDSFKLTVLRSKSSVKCEGSDRQGSCSVTRAMRGPSLHSSNDSHVPNAVFAYRVAGSDPKLMTFASEFETSIMPPTAQNPFLLIRSKEGSIKPVRPK